MKREKIYSIFIIIILNAFLLNSSTFYAKSNNTTYARFDHLSSENGLPNTDISHILCDSYGFMWLTFNNELYQYDGKTFKIYQNNKNNKNSLTGGLITSITEDINNHLWIGTRYGLSKFDPKKENFTNFYALENSISDNDISTLTINGSYLWITYKNKNIIDKLNIYTSKIKHYENIFNDNVNGVCIDKDDEIWCYSNKGISKYNSLKDSFVFNSLNILDEYGNPLLINISNMLGDSLGNIWFIISSTDNEYDEIIKVNKKTLIYNKYSNYLEEESYLPAKKPQKFFEDSNKNIWISTYNDGLIKYISSTKSFYNYKTTSTLRTSLFNNRILAIAEDASGSIWASSYKNGINIIKPSIFTNYVHLSYNKNSLSSNISNIVFEDSEGYIWIGTENGGLNIYNPKNDTFSILNLPDGSIIPVISDIKEDNSDNIWIGTSSNGLYRYNKKNKNFTHYTYTEVAGSLLTNKITRLYLDRYGNFWVGTSYGLHRFNSITNTFDWYQDIGEAYITDFYLDNNNILWISTDNSGLFAYNNTQKSLTHYSPIEIDPKAITSTNIYGIFQDNNNILLGTQNGLIKFNKNTKVFKHIETSMIDLNTSIYKIINDNDNNLWMISKTGLIKYSKKNNAYKKYTTDDGLTTNEFVINGLTKLKNGNIIVSSRFGFSVFNPNKINVPIKQPKLSVTLLKDDEKYISYGLTPQKIKFTHKNNNLVVNMSLLDFKNVSKNTYYYMLEGFDETWINAGHSNFISYNNLNNGDYILKLKGANSDSVFSEVISIPITVTLPIYKSWWAYILYILIFLSTIFMILYFYNKKINNYKEALSKEKELNEQFKNQNQPDINIEQDRINIIAEQNNITSEDNLVNSNYTSNNYDNILKVLIINNKNKDSTNISTLLSEIGYSVTKVSTGEDALNIFNNGFSFDLIIVNDTLPKISGFEVCKQLRKQYSLLKLPILMILYNPLPESIPTVYSSGSNDYIINPLNQVELVQKVNALLVFSQEAKKALKITKQNESEKIKRTLIAAMKDVSTALTSTLILSEVLKNLLKSIQQIILFENGYVLLIENDKLHLSTMMSSIDFHHANDKIQSINNKSQLMQFLLSNKKPLVFNTGANNIDYIKDLVIGNNIESFIAIPLLYSDNHLGLLILESFEQNNFIEPYTSLLFSLGTQASIIIQNAKLYEEITNLSTTDSLTGLSNRNHFLVELESNILKARRYDRSLSCIIIDIDDFKMITDNYDHYIGDEIIKHVAVIIKNSVREVDIASRYGSEKFALILPETSYRDAVHVSERIKSDINKNVFYLNDTHIDITISCGIATYDDSIESVNELIKRADNARYKKQRTKKKLNT